jgi:hypothetical protein
MTRCTDNHERSPLSAVSPFSALLVALLLTLPALLPLLRGGFFVSDDGLFHVYRTAALAEAWQQGVLWPRLFPDFRLWLRPGGAQLLRAAELCAGRAAELCWAWTRPRRCRW